MRQSGSKDRWAISVTREAAGQYRALLQECQYRAAQMQIFAAHPLGKTKAAQDAAEATLEQVEERLCYCVERCREFEVWLAAIPDKDLREIMALRYVAGLSFVQIGERVHKNPDTVKKAVYRYFNRNS